MLDRARGLMTTGHAVSALAVLDTYDVTFPHGALSQEAEALRIDALARSGQKDSARARATRFLAAHPESPQAPRVRAIVNAQTP